MREETSIMVNVKSKCPFCGKTYFVEEKLTRKDLLGLLSVIRNEKKKKKGV